MRLSFAFLLAMPLFLLPSLKAFAAYEHQRIQRIVVFPFQVDVDRTDADLRKAAEDAWWQVREKLTESKQFLVASRDFMMAKEVFQPRGELQPADALILGRLLDADALVTVFLKGNELNMRVYETTNGLTLWSGQLMLDPALLPVQQFEPATEKLLYRFVASIPYQGYVIVDPIVDRPTFHKNDNLMFRAHVGLNTQLTKGEDVQLIRVQAIGTNPVFQSSLNIQVYAEGVITDVDHQVITVEVTRRQTGAKIEGGALVRIPDEFQRLQKAYGIQPDLTKNLGVEFYRLNNDELTEKQKNRQPLITSLAFIGNLVLVLFVAF